MIYKAIFFDGVSSTPQRVNFSLNGQDLLIFSQERTISYQRNECEIARSFSNAAYHVNFTDGARLEVSDESFNEYVSASESIFNKKLNQLKHKPSFILMALILSTLALFFFLTDGLQTVAKVATKVFPIKTEKMIGKYIVDSEYFEKSFFQLSSLSLGRQEQIRTEFSHYCAKIEVCPEYKIKFRQSKIFGANAFALPGGDIIITDDLVNLAGDEDEITAVLAHELGHIAKRHSLQQMIQTSLRALILVGITGDVDSIASALPGLMFDLKYSREIEVDADNYAIAFMEKNCVPLNSFAKIMEKMAKKNPKNNDPDSIDKIRTIFSTHPSYGERVRKFQSKPTRCES